MKKILAVIIFLVIPAGLISCKQAGNALRSSKNSKETGKAVGKTIGAGSKAYRLSNEEDE